MVQTVGIILEQFDEFAKEFSEDPAVNEKRQRRLLYIMIKPMPITIRN